MSWDLDLFHVLNGLAGHSPVLDRLMFEFTHPGNLMMPGILVFAYWVWRNLREAVIGATSLAGLIVLVDFIGLQIKNLTARPRPCHALEQINLLIGCGGTFSFPSNHAVNTATAAAFFQVLYPASGWISWPLVAIIGFSRVYLGGHYVTDVLGGWLIGAVLGTVAALLLLRWPKFRPTPRGTRPHMMTEGSIPHS